MKSEEVLQRNGKSKNNQDMKMSDQQDYKKRLGYIMVAVNILFNGLGSVFLISFFFRTFVSRNDAKNELIENEFLTKSDQEIIKYKLDEIFHIIYLHAACLGITYFLNVIQEIFADNKIDKSKQSNENAKQQFLISHQLLGKYIFNNTILSIFFFNSIYSAWIMISPIQFKRLIYLVMIHLSGYLHNSIAQFCPSESFIQQLRYLMVSLAVVTHLIIIFNNQRMPTLLLL